MRQETQWAAGQPVKDIWKFESTPLLAIEGVLQQIFPDPAGSGWTLRQGAMHDMESYTGALVCTALFGK